VDSEEEMRRRGGAREGWEKSWKMEWIWVASSLREIRAWEGDKRRARRGEERGEKGREGG